MIFGNVGNVYVKYIGVVSAAFRRYDQPLEMSGVLQYQLDDHT
jgi:hypothetical protein